MTEISPVKFGELLAEVHNLVDDVKALRAENTAMATDLRQLRRDLDRLQHRGWGMLMMLGSLAGGGGLIGGGFIPDLLKKLGF